MGPLALLALAVGFVVVALYLAGERVPLRTTARLCLWEAIRDAGLGARVPPACVNAIADQLAVEVAARAAPAAGRRSRARAERAALMAAVADAARVVRGWVAGLPAQPGTERVIALLAAHGVQGGAPGDAGVAPRPGG